MFGFRRLSLAYFLGAGIIAVEVISNLRAADPHGLSLQGQLAIGVLAAAFYSGDAAIKRKRSEIETTTTTIVDGDGGMSRTITTSGGTQNDKG